MKVNKVLNLIIVMLIFSIICPYVSIADQTNPSGFVSEGIEGTQSGGTQSTPIPSTQVTQSVGEILSGSDGSTQTTTSQSTTSTTTTSESTSQNGESEMDQLQLEKENAENKIQENESQIQFDQEQLSSTLLELEKVSQEIADKQQQVAELELQEIELNKTIKSTTKKLEAAKEDYEKQDELLRARLIAMYKMSDVSYLDVLLNSKSLSHFLSNYFLLEKVAKADNELLDSAKEKWDSIKQLSLNLDAAKNTLEANKETIEKTKIALSNIQIIKNNKAVQLNEDEAKLHAEIEEYRKQIQSIELEIRSLALKNVSERYVGGVMAWPVPGYTRITSPFGMRTHPITGVYKLHSGTDIGAPEGSTFIAANDGVVVKAGYNGAYGNMVIIDHGGGIQTLYAHGSKICVSIGQTVFKGDEVLKVGHTGYATGPHAHFEVRINGSPVEPLDYITSYNSKQSGSSEIVVSQ